MLGFGACGSPHRVPMKLRGDHTVELGFDGQDWVGYAAFNDQLFRLLGMRDARHVREACGREWVPKSDKRRRPAGPGAAVKDSPKKDSPKELGKEGKAERDRCSTGSGSRRGSDAGPSEEAEVDEFVAAQPRKRESVDVKIACVTRQPARLLYDVLQDSDYAHGTWDRAAAEPRSVSHLSHNNAVLRYRSPSAVLPSVFPRDIYVQKAWFEFDSGDFLIVSTVIDPDEEPPDAPPALRVAYYVRPVDDGHASEIMFLCLHSEQQKGAACPSKAAVNFLLTMATASRLRALVQAASGYEAWLKERWVEGYDVHDPTSPPHWTTPLVSWFDDEIAQLASEEYRGRNCIYRSEEAIRREAIASSELPQFFDVDLVEVPINGEEGPAEIIRSLREENETLKAVLFTAKNYDFDEYHEGSLKPMSPTERSRSCHHLQNQIEVLEAQIFHLQQLLQHKKNHLRDIASSGDLADSSFTRLILMELNCEKPDADGAARRPKKKQLFGMPFRKPSSA
ncbi:hypothetical protein DIPPA_26202 [Diplonema papillatum]|nr:hypothetical protein DIPPA_26202 [Diplonema papillatum]